MDCHEIFCMVSSIQGLTKDQHFQIWFKNTATLYGHVVAFASDNLKGMPENERQQKPACSLISLKSSSRRHFKTN